MLRLEVIRDSERLASLCGDWIRLANSGSRVTPFQLPDWQLTWWKHFGGGKIRSYAFWDDHELVGMIPAFRHLWNGRRQVTLIGSGVTDYLEPCLLAADAVDLLSAELQRDLEWDVCDWQDLYAETPLQSLCGLRVAVAADVPCSAIPLTGGFDDYWGSRSADLRRNIKRYSRKAEAEGALEFRIVGGADTQLLEALLCLHRERWHKQGEPGMVDLNQSGDFLRDVTRFESCRLFSLTWKGEVVAATAGFLRDRTVYSYLSAFDPQYEILGFGRYLLYQSLRWAFGNGYERWDFLRGEESYKASWGAVPIQKCRLFITRS